MFQKVFEYAGPHKKGLYAATAVVLVSVLMGVLPFVLAYQVIAPLVMGAELDASFCRLFSMAGGSIFRTRPPMTRCSGYGLPCKSGLRSCLWA